MKVIGLTGGIGSGKSTVAGFLVELGAVLIDADKINGEILEPDAEGWRQVVGAFGKNILRPDRQIDRPKLAKIIFDKPELRKKLEGILHPIITGIILNRLAELRQQGTKATVLESPLLIEADWRPFVDEIWITVASEATVLKRLKERSGYSEAQSLARIRAQMSNEERIKFADRVINTDGSLEDVRKQVKKLWQNLEV